MVQGSAYCACLLARALYVFLLCYVDFCVLWIFEVFWWQVSSFALVFEFPQRLANCHK
jgi:hypothetical protein